MSGFKEYDVVGSTLSTANSAANASVLFGNTLICIRDPRMYVLLEIIFSALSLPIHIFVVVSMIIYRNVVKRNVANIYGANVMIGNTVISLWRVLSQVPAYSDGSVKYYNIHQNGTADHTEDGLFMWWTFKKAFTLIMLLVSSGSIGLVINVLRASMFRVHRTVAGVATAHQSCPSADEGAAGRSNVSCLKSVRQIQQKHPKWYAVLFIWMVWTFPILLTIPPVLLNSCDMNCQCPFDKRQANDSTLVYCPRNKHCSGILPPISTTTILTGFCLWLVYITVLCFYLAKTYLDLRKVEKKRATKDFSANENNELGAMNDSKVSSRTRESNEDNSAAGDEEKTRHATLKIRKSRKSAKSGSTSGKYFLETGRSNLRLLISMYIAYVVGSAPLAAFALHDSYHPVADRDTLDLELIPIVILPIFSEVFCTIMLCFYMSGIKKATRLLLLAITRSDAK